MASTTERPAKPWGVRESCEVHREVVGDAEGEGVVSRADPVPGEQRHR